MRGNDDACSTHGTKDDSRRDQQLADECGAVIVGADKDAHHPCVKEPNPPGDGDSLFAHHNEVLQNIHLMQLMHDSSVFTEDFTLMVIAVSQGLRLYDLLP